MPKHDFWQPPVDYARRLERERATFLTEVRYDLRPMEIAKICLKAGYSKGYGSEGLRGLWIPPSEANPDGSLVWWLARLCSHWEGARHLGLTGGPDNRGARCHDHEVEINIDDGGDLYLQWANGADAVGAAVQQHPTLKDSFVDGSLAVRGRIIRLVEGRITLDPRKDPK